MNYPAKMYVPFMNPPRWWLAVSLLIIASGLNARNPERVEPPFWWSGMHHTELQVMVYGPDIGLTRAEMTHPGIRIREMVTVESPNYMFLYLDISQATPGRFPIRFYSGKELKYTYDFELREREPGSAFREGVNASDAIYLLMPDRFSNADPANDDMPGMLEKADRNNPDGRHGGDIAGIVNHLDYVRDMGFTTLWINPLLENNQPRYSYHGYAITDFYRIDPRFGSNADYRHLVNKAGEKGMKVLKDMILNHCGHHHWWMNDLPAPDWINKWDSFTRTTYRISTQLDPHAAWADHAQMAYGWFDTNMPDLNQRNRLLAQYLKQNAVWWIEYSGIRGIRMDTQPYSDRNFMSDWAGYIRNEYPDFLIIGEAWVGVPALISYFQGGKQNHDGYDSHMPSVFDFAMYDAIRSGLTEQEGWSSGLMRLYDVLAQDFLYPDPYNLVVFADNHDVSRIFSVLGEDPDLLKMALTFIFTTRGIPQVYYGTELLMSGWEHEGHGHIREDFPGGWAGDAINAFLPEGRNHQQQQITDHISDLLHFRKSKSALHYGWLRQFVPRDNVYVYFRYDETDTIMVIMNANDGPYDLRLSRFKEAWEGFGSAEDVLNGSTYNTFDTWTIPGRTALVLELR
jgi:neopullulanase